MLAGSNVPMVLVVVLAVITTVVGHETDHVNQEQPQEQWQPLADPKVAMMNPQLEQGQQSVTLTMPSIETLVSTKVVRGKVQLRSFFRAWLVFWPPLFGPAQIILDDAHAARMLSACFESKCGSPVVKHIEALSQLEGKGCARKSCLQSVAKTAWKFVADQTSSAEVIAFFDDDACLQDHLTPDDIITPDGRLVARGLRLVGPVAEAFGVHQRSWMKQNEWFGLEMTNVSYMVEFPVLVWREMIVDFRAHVNGFVLGRHGDPSVELFLDAYERIYERYDIVVVCEFCLLLNFAAGSPKWRHRYRFDTWPETSPMLVQSVHHFKTCPRPKAMWERSAKEEAQFALNRTARGMFPIDSNEWSLESQEMQSFKTDATRRALAAMLAEQSVRVRDFAGRHNRSELSWYELCQDAVDKRWEKCVKGGSGFRSEYGRKRRWKRNTHQPQQSKQRHRFGKKETRPDPSRQGRQATNRNHQQVDQSEQAMKRGGRSWLAAEQEGRRDREPMFGRKPLQRWMSRACQDYYSSRLPSMAPRCAHLERRNAFLAFKSKWLAPQTCVNEDLHSGGRGTAVNVPPRYQTSRASKPANEFMVNHKFKVVYVENRNCASSTMLKVFRQLFGTDFERACPKSWESECRSGMPMSRCSTECLPQLGDLSGYFFFTFVCDPVDRFFSAFDQELRVDFMSVDVEDCAAVQEKMKGVLDAIEHNHSVYEAHLESQAYTLSSPVRGDFGTGMLQFDFIEDVRNLDASLPQLLAKIEDNSGQKLPRIQKQQLLSKPLHENTKASSKRLTRSTSACRTPEIEERVRKTYQQDMVCFTASEEGAQ